MLFFNSLITVILIKSVSSYESSLDVVCNNNTHRNVHARKEFRKVIQNEGSLDLVIDYAINYEKKTEKTEDYIVAMMKPRKLTMPIALFQNLDFKRKFTIYIYSDLASNFLSNIELYLFKLSPSEFSGLENLENNSEVTHVQVLNKSNDTNFNCFMIMKSCRLTKTQKKGVYNVSKELLYFFFGQDFFNSSEIKKCFSSNFTMKNLTFPEFNSLTGYDLCKHLNYYVNDCKNIDDDTDDNDIANKIFAGILMSIIIIIIIVEIYNCIIIRNDESE